MRRTAACGQCREQSLDPVELRPILRESIVDENLSSKAERQTSEKNPVMLFVVLFVILYFLLQLVILPGLGIPT